MVNTEHRWLSAVLLFTGIAFILVYPLMSFLPGSWGWEPRQYEYEQMIQGIYLVLGVFAVIASRQALRHLSLTWFIAVSCLFRRSSIRQSMQTSTVIFPR